MNTKIEYEYGCEGKKYHIEYYSNHLERQECYGASCKVEGTIENFNPAAQTAIKNNKGELILIDSRLIAVMRPMNKFELKEFEKGNKENETKR